MWDRCETMSDAGASAVVGALFARALRSFALVTASSPLVWLATTAFGVDGRAAPAPDASALVRRPGDVLVLVLLVLLVLLLVLLVLLLVLLLLSEALARGPRPMLDRIVGTLARDVDPP
jgi:hypothetical protein